MIVVVNHTSKSFSDNYPGPHNTVFLEGGTRISRLHPAGPPSSSEDAPEVGGFRHTPTITTIATFEPSRQHLFYHMFVSSFYMLAGFDTN